MVKNRPNPDNRSDNVEKLQAMVHNTLENIEAAEETAAFAGPEERQKIKEKNEKRKQSLSGFREEIKDEASNRQN